MTEHCIRILPKSYHEVIAGIKTFINRKDDGSCEVGDKLVMREHNGTMFTGRSIECLITDVYRGDFAKDGYCILSFQIIYPESEPRLSVSSYMELYDLYVKSRSECEALKEK